MAFNSTSLSESVQASMIFHQREDKPQQHRKSHLDDGVGGRSDVTNKKQEQGHQEEGLPLYVQCLLTTAFIGIDMCATFTVIYMLLFLQFLGVPTSLLTSEGILGGGLAFILLPILGYFSDRGSNLVMRKMKIVSVSVALYTTGFVGLAVCAGLRLNYNTENTTNTTFTQNLTGPIVSADDTHQIMYYLHHNDTTVSPSLHNFNVSGSISSSSDINILHTTGVLHSNTSYYKQPKGFSGKSENTYGVLQIVGILSNGFMDAGFDTGMSTYRAYILQVSPPSVHNRLLIMATVTGSLGGVAIAAIGQIDLPNIIGTKFGVDGTPGTVLMFSCGILSCILLGSICTIVTGYVVYRNRNLYTSIDVNDKHNQRYSKSKLQQNNEIISQDKWSLFVGSNRIPQCRYSGIDCETKPLLEAGSGGIRSYAAQEEGSASYIKHNTSSFQENGDFDRVEYHKTLASSYNEPLMQLYKSSEINSFDYNDNDQNYYHHSHKDRHSEDGDRNYIDSSDIRDDDLGIIDKEYELESSNKLNNLSVEQKTCPNSNPSKTLHNVEKDTDLSVKQNYLSGIQKSLLNDIPHSAVSITQQSELEGTSIWKCRRLKFLLLAVFFTFGSNTVCMMFSGNSLTIGVYHGDPNAPPETPGRANYNKGLRNIALGNLLMYCTYAVVSLLNKKIIDMVGEKIWYSICQSALLVSFLVFILIKSEETYFILNGVSGFYRGCAYTVGYIMVNDLVKKETSKRGGDPERHIGKVMAMVGFLLPSIYTIMSAIIGPLMAAFNTVWVPMSIAAIMNGLALLAFGLFVVTKG